ncbi:hypothetical protein MRX96_024535 [Rhipicephalus microplus]
MKAAGGGEKNVRARSRKTSTSSSERLLAAAGEIPVDQWLTSQTNILSSDFFNQRVKHVDTFAAAATRDALQSAVSRLFSSARTSRSMSRAVPCAAPVAPAEIQRGYLPPPLLRHQIHWIDRQPLSPINKLPPRLDCASLLVSLGWGKKTAKAVNELVQKRRRVQMRRLLLTSDGVSRVSRHVQASVPLFSAAYDLLRRPLHIFYSCPAHLPPASWNFGSPQQWEAALSSIRPDLQLRLVTWVKDVVARHCLDATTGSLKAAHNAAF